jgi:hypothetical protein
VVNRRELLERLPADALSRTLGRDDFGVLGFEVFEPLEQAIELTIADNRCGLDVVEAVVAIDLRSELGYLTLDVY